MMIALRRLGLVLTATAAGGLAFALPHAASAAKKPTTPPEVLERSMATLERGAKSGDFNTRAAAVRGLGDAPKDRALPVLLDALTDAQWNVRVAAIMGLRVHKDASWKKALTESIRDPRINATAEILPALAELGLKEGGALLTAALATPKFPRPERYAEALAKAGGDWMALGYKAGLKLKDPDAASAFTTFLPKLPLPDAVPIYKASLAKLAPDLQTQVVDHVIADDRVKDVGFLKPLLRSKDVALAFKVAAALAARGDKSGRAVLVTAAKGEDAASKLSALHALAGVAAADLFDIAKPIIKDDKSSIELIEAAYEIYATVGNPKLAGHLENRINGTDLARRAAAVKFIGRVKGKAALPILESLLGDGAKVVRLNAATAVGQLGQRSSIEPLRQALFNEPDSDVKLATIEALGAIRDQECIAALRFQISDRDRKVRKAAVTALGAVRHESAAADLDIAMRDTDRVIRAVAVRALLDLDVKRYTPQFRRALGWIEPADLLELSAKHGPDFVEHLKMAFESTRPELREAALKATLVLDKRSSSAILGGIAEHSKRADLRVQALDALIESNGKDSIELLERMTKDSSTAVRVAALAGLGRLGAKEAVPLLMQATNALEEHTRVVAAAALLRI